MGRASINLAPTWYDPPPLERAIMSDTADQAASVRRYDFSSAEDKPARPLMPALEAALERINDRFARFARAVLLQHLHRAVTVGWN
jgi:flagellar motor switch protein FliM